MLKYVPEVVGVHLPPLALLVLALLPLVIDTSPERHPARRRRVVAGWCVVWLGLVALGVLGHLSGTTQEILGRLVHFDVQGVPHVLEAEAQDG
jgi:quinol-cytochrome oxidoreductase complex cytochrome b subunit